jgi:nucleoid-associated protein YejK
MSLLRPRGLLYHYTTVEGFLGILESDSIRATHIRYMNDSQEFVDALGHMGTLVGELVSEFERCNADLRQAMSNVGDTFAGRFEKLRESLRVGLGEFLCSISSPMSRRNSAYIVSFTDDAALELTLLGPPGDRLSQWRAYGGGGKGISLGFDHSALCGVSMERRGIREGARRFS